MKRRCLIIATALFVLHPLDAQAQLVDDIDGLFEDTRIFNGDAGSSLTVDTSGFPTSATIDDSFTGGGTNRHDLLFSNDGGSSPRLFMNQEAFDISVDVTIDALSASPRKEAGIRINFLGFDGLFIINSDANEIVAFGGTLPFFAFPSTYDLGETINMRMVYTPPILNELEEVVTPGTVEYIVDEGSGPATSGPLDFGGLEGGIIDESEIGVYAQGAGASGDFISATFGNFSFTGPPTIPGDADGDGDVDVADALEIQRTTGDLTDWKLNFPSGGAVSAVTAVPEPSSCGLLLALIGLATPRRRRP